MIKYDVKGIRELKAKFATLKSQLDSTVEIHFNIYLNTLISNIRRRITDETGPNGPLYTKAKDKVFGGSLPYEVTGTLVKNIQSVKLPSSTSDQKRWSFGVQPIKEDTYSINLIFEMFRTGKRGMAPDIHKLSTEIATELETKYPNFKYFYKFFGDNNTVIKQLLADELNDIILSIVDNIFK
jgi:hypothetical protein